jgi:hypothetical protein
MYRVNRFTSIELLRTCSVVILCVILLSAIAVSHRASPNQNSVLGDFKLSSFIVSTNKQQSHSSATSHQQDSTTHSIKQCAPHTSLNTAYSQSAAIELQNLNAQVDTLRQGAQTSGESYQTFDSQANSEFNNYNLQAAANYNAYLKSLNGCTSSIAAPTDFSMFTP